MEAPVGATEFEAAGIYDPAAPGAATRLALLEHLVSRGATLEELREAADGELLPALAGELARRPDGELLTVREAAERASLSTDTVQAIWRSGGLPDPPLDVPYLSPEDAEGLANFALGAEMFGADATLRFVRVMGTATAAIADAAMAIFNLNVQPRYEREDVDELEYARMVEFATATLTRHVPVSITSFFLHHVDAALRRTQGSPGGATVHMSIGFLDLVGSTPLSVTASPEELEHMLNAFESATTEVVAAHGGRVVKHIGDEVMFVVPSAGAACDVALELCQRFGPEHDTPALRGALACGDLVRGYGDYYGAVVNLAARLVKLATPGTVLTTAAVRDEAASNASVSFTPAGSPTPRGFDEPVDVFTIGRG